MFRFARGGDGTGLISRADIAAPRERARAALIARDPRAFISLSLSAARRRERERERERETRLNEDTFEASARARVL